MDKISTHRQSEMWTKNGNAKLEAMNKTGCLVCHNYSFFTRRQQSAFKMELHCIPTLLENSSGLGFLCFVVSKDSCHQPNPLYGLLGFKFHCLLSYDRPGMCLYIPLEHCLKCFFGCSLCALAPRPPRGLLALAHRCWGNQWYLPGVMSEGA